MSMFTTSAGAQSVLPPEYGELVTKPVEALSVAYLTGTAVRTAANKYHVPILASDVTVGAVSEGAEITPSDAAFNELVVTPAKFAGLTIVSRELADDSNPSAADQIGKSIARQIAKAVDNALFNALSAPNPAGFASLSGISTVAAPLTYTNLDPFEEAISLSEAAGGRVTTWVTGAATALEIAKLKDASGSNKGLLNPDLTAEGRRTILGRPVVVSSYVPADVVYGISKDDFLVVTREDTRLDVDHSAYFSSDRVGVRGTMRVAFAMPVAAAHVRITNAAA
ncbi:phage major capsid protein [Streptomyces sp. H34-S4]|uniref:phage major capsid protein n=1 Tax=Streptomyces sp. H34-S4 TaxID=2996463 RepID=UPI00226D4218|nr:phage major capsid protein [Streptomyces sp. H34-S4]MCY0933187.1 phage major capsid protein [Streptomyces sp. H34-S4]